MYINTMKHIVSLLWGERGWSRDDWTLNQRSSCQRRRAIQIVNSNNLAIDLWISSSKTVGQNNHPSQYDIVTNLWILSFWSTDHYSHPQKFPLGSFTLAFTMPKSHWTCLICLQIRLLPQHMSPKLI